MPSKSQKQHNLMAMVANDPKAAKRVGISQAVGQEFMKADKGKKFGSGAPRSRPDLQKANKPKTQHGSMKLFKEGGEMKKMKMGGMAASKMGKVVAGGKKPHGEHTVQKKGHTKGKMITMKRGGRTC